MAEIPQPLQVSALIASPPSAKRYEFTTLRGSCRWGSTFRVRSISRGSRIRKMNRHRSPSPHPASKIRIAQVQARGYWLSPMGRLSAPHPDPLPQPPAHRGERPQLVGGGGQGWGYIDEWPGIGGHRGRASAGGPCPPKSECTPAFPSDSTHPTHLHSASPAYMQPAHSDSGCPLPASKERVAIRFPLLIAIVQIHMATRNVAPRHIRHPLALRSPCRSRSEFPRPWDGPQGA
jgi:hypothetical protein